MQFEVKRAFPTLIGQFRMPDSELMNRDLEALVLAEEAQYPTLGQSNIGGWHSRPDILARPHAAVSALNQWITWALRKMIEASTEGNKFQGALSAFGWATICRSGSYHAPHSHPESAWSGVYYVNAGNQSPEWPLSGVLEFIDPRAGIDAVTAPGDPYGEPIRIWPEASLLVIFPSWLSHWVHPYAGETSRIAISFNATTASSTMTVSGEETVGAGVTPVAGGTQRMDAGPA